MNTLTQVLDEIFEFIKNLVPTGAEQYLLVIGAALGLTISVAVGGFDDLCAYSVDDTGLYYRYYRSLPYR